MGPHANLRQEFTQRGAVLSCHIGSTAKGAGRMGRKGTQTLLSSPHEAGTRPHQGLHNRANHTLLPHSSMSYHTGRRPARTPALSNTIRNPITQSPAKHIWGSGNTQPHTTLTSHHYHTHSSCQPQAMDRSLQLFAEAMDDQLEYIVQAAAGHIPEIDATKRACAINTFKLTIKDLRHSLDIRHDTTNDYSATEVVTKALEAGIQCIRDLVPASIPAPGLKLLAAARALKQTPINLMLSQLQQLAGEGQRLGTVLDRAFTDPAAYGGSLIVDVATAVAEHAKGLETSRVLREAVNGGAAAAAPLRQQHHHQQNIAPRPRQLAPEVRAAIGEKGCVHHARYVLELQPNPCKHGKSCSYSHNFDITPQLHQAQLHHNRQQR